MWPVCDDETWQQWRQCARGHVLGDELIHNNLTTPFLYKCIQTRTCTQKKHSFSTTHTLAHMQFQQNPPAPTAFSDLHLVLESAGTQVGLPPADIWGEFMQRLMCGSAVSLCSFFWNKCLPALLVTYKSGNNCILSKEEQGQSEHTVNPAIRL